MPYHRYLKNKRQKVFTSTYSSCCSVFDTSVDRDHLRKMQLKRPNRRSGGTGRGTLFSNLAASTIQTNGDLQTS